MTSLNLYRDAALNRVDSRRMGRSLARLDGQTIFDLARWALSVPECPACPHPHWGSRRWRAQGSATPTGGGKTHLLGRGKRGIPRVQAVRAASGRMSRQLELASRFHGYGTPVHETTAGCWTRCHAAWAWRRSLRRSRVFRFDARVEEVAQSHGHALVTKTQQRDAVPVVESFGGPP
jgi:hypothetical protein